MSPRSYESLKKVSARYARRLVYQHHNEHVARSGRAKYMVEKAEELIALVPHENEARVAAEAMEGMMSLACEDWWGLASGERTGEDLMRGTQLWRSVMEDWPMGSYAVRLGQVLRDFGLFPDGEILEIGAGVGATTSVLVAIEPQVTVIRSDMHAFRGINEVWDFTLRPHPRLRERFPLVVGTNAVHCATNITGALSNIRETLAPDGILVISEGNPEPAAGEPWALDWVFGMFDGWWNTGGFRSYEQWENAFSQAGFSKLERFPYESRGYQLGHVLCARH